MDCLATETLVFWAPEVFVVPEADVSPEPMCGTGILAVSHYVVITIPGLWTFCLCFCWRKLFLFVCFENPIKTVLFISGWLVFPCSPYYTVYRWCIWETQINTVYEIMSINFQKCSYSNGTHMTVPMSIFCRNLKINASPLQYCNCSVTLIVSELQTKSMFQCYKDKLYNQVKYHWTWIQPHSFRMWWAMFTIVIP